METNNLKTIKPLPPQVASWFISLDEVTGVYELIINTVDRWVDYHRRNDTLFDIGNCEEDESCYCNLEIPDFLPKLPKGSYYTTCHSQNKDQIFFYYIPKVHRRNTVIMSNRQTGNI